MPADPTSIVRDFCDAWATGDLDALMTYFASDAVYHNIPVDPVVGTEAIRATIAGFTTGVESVEFRVLHLAASDDVVLTERVDVFKFPKGTIELPVSGTFEITDGKIVAWRDYFDMQQFMSKLPEVVG